MSAFSIVERRRREELLAIQNQDRLQTQTTAEPDIASTAEQPDPPPEESRMPLINATGLDRESESRAVQSALEKRLDHLRRRRIGMQINRDIQRFGRFEDLPEFGIVQVLAARMGVDDRAL